MSQNDDTIIQFSGLKPGFYKYSFTLDGEFFERWKNDEIRDGNVIFDVEMERKEHLLMFKFQMKGELTTMCDRCLGDLKIPVEGEEHLCVRFSDTEVCDDEDVVVLPEKSFEIDLAQWLYEYAAVRIPMQHIHPEGECDPEVTKYIKVESGEWKVESEEIDPRWEALKKLK
jgi:uncharacterized metal-binding protein YceD (DUF177 family)